MHYNLHEWSIKQLYMQWKVTCWGLCSETAWLCNWLSHFFDLSFSLVARIKHLKLLQAVMLSDPLQRASGSYNHQRFNFSNLLSFKKVWSVSICSYLFIVQLVCFDLPHYCQSLFQLLAGSTGSDPQCYEHASCFDSPWGYTACSSDHSSSFCLRSATAHAHLIISGFWCSKR